MKKWGLGNELVAVAGICVDQQVNFVGEGQGMEIRNPDRLQLCLLLPKIRISKDSEGLPVYLGDLDKPVCAGVSFWLLAWNILSLMN